MTTQTLKRKPIFDAVRRLLGRKFAKADVSLIDAAIDRAIAGGNAKPDVPSKHEDQTVPSRISEAGTNLIKRFEGCARKRRDGKIEAYPDPGTGGDPWTIGWGSTGADHFNGGRIKRGTVWTLEQCNERKERDLARYADEVVNALGDAINGTSQAQFDALVSFHYNTGAIFRATLTKKHRAGDYEGAAAEFGRWVNAGGRRLAGLVKRRKAEAELYRSGT